MRPALILLAALLAGCESAPPAPPAPDPDARVWGADDMCRRECAADSDVASRLCNCEAYP